MTYKPVTWCWNCGGFWHEWEAGEICIGCGFPIQPPDVIRQQWATGWLTLDVRCYPPLIMEAT
jgi:hypothetical protein